MRTGCQLGWILASKIHENLLLGGSWVVLWPSWAVLGRLGRLFRRLEEASENDGQKKATKSQSKVRHQAFLEFFGGVSPWTGHGRAVGSGPLNCHFPLLIPITHSHYSFPITHLTLRHAFAQKRGGGYLKLLI